MPARSDRDPSRGRKGLIGSDVERSLRRRGLFHVTHAAWVMSEANQLAKKRFTAASFRDGELTCVPGTLPVTELELAREEYRHAINKKIGREVVRSMRFKQS